MRRVWRKTRSLRACSQKGFTLIELIAVLVILGVLSAVAMPQFMGLKAEAENKAALQAVMEGKNRLTSQYAIKLMTSEEEEANNLAAIAAARQRNGDRRRIAGCHPADPERAASPHACTATGDGRTVRAATLCQFANSGRHRQGE